MIRVIRDRNNYKLGLLGLVFAFVLLLCSQALGESWNTLVFRDDFDTGNTPDPKDWVTNKPNYTWWIQGRTHFPDPNSTTVPFPRIENGVCAIEHHHYNQYHLGTPKTTFLGGEIHSVRMFAPNSSYRFEARVKCAPYPNGLVTSFFVYGCHCRNSDEGDFEYLSKMTNDDVNYPEGDPVLVNPWNESYQNPMYVVPNGLDLSEWNTFRLYWYPNDGLFQWTWVDPCDVERLLRTETNAFFVPDEPMSIYFNFWAPNENWSEAFDANLQPVSDPNANEIFRFEIDYVEVRMPGPGCGDANHPYPPGDLDFDCNVNWFDLEIFAIHWLENCRAPECYGAGDFNQDHIVNLFDFGVFADHWWECTDPNFP